MSNNTTQNETLNEKASENIEVPDEVRKKMEAAENFAKLTPDEQFQRQMLGLLAKQLELVDKHGYATLHIGAAEGDGTDTEDYNSVMYNYTVGAAQLGLPDVIIVAPLPPDLASMIIDSIMNQWRETGFALDTNLADESPIRVGLRALEPTEELHDKWFGHTTLFYSVQKDYLKRGADVPSHVQILLPDREGRLPTEVGYDTQLLPQRLLPELQAREPAKEHAREDEGTQSGTPT